jgi:hypothetical protein
MGHHHREKPSVAHMGDHPSVTVMEIPFLWSHSRLAETKPAANQFTSLAVAGTVLHFGVVTVSTCQVNEERIIQ